MISLPTVHPTKSSLLRWELCQYLHIIIVQGMHCIVKIIIRLFGKWNTNGDADLNYFYKS